MKNRVLFVCLGNICRSPAAEGIFAAMVKERGLESKFDWDSAGTSAYHAGEPADGRMQSHCLERGYNLESYARQFIAEDFENFDLILTMDDTNFENVLKMDKQDLHAAKVKKMVSFCKMHNVEEVPDPYFGGDDGFRLVVDILEDACSELLNQYT